MAERVYCPGLTDIPSQTKSLEILGDEAGHLGRVRRVGMGEVVEVFNGRGFASLAEVVHVTRDCLTLQILGAPLPDRLSSIRLTLATAVPKGERFDWLVEKAVELGVSTLQPLVTERSVVDPRVAKLDRLRRAVIEASKQCGRNLLMTIARPSTWAELLRDSPADVSRFVAHPSGERFSGSHRLAGPNALVAIGPEGGFTDAEIEAARSRGWQIVALGSTLLRIETAAIVATTRVMALAECDGGPVQRNGA